MSDDIPKLTEAEFARAMPQRQRERLMRGEFRGGRVLLPYPAGAQTTLRGISRPASRRARSASRGT